MTKTLTKNFIVLGIISVISLYLLIVPAHHSQEFLWFHLLLEFFSVAVAYSIAIQGWTIYRLTYSQKRLWVGASFLSVALFELFHTITFSNIIMTASNELIHLSSWFWLLARISAAIGIVLYLTLSDTKLTDQKGRLIYPGALLTSIIFIIAVLIWGQSLPALNRDVETSGVFHDIVDHSFFLLYAGMFIAVVQKYMTTKKQPYLTILFSLLFINLSDIILTMVINPSHNLIFLGHIYRALAYYFLLKAIFFQSDDSIENMVEQKDNDHLTGLPNRLLFKQKIQEQMRDHPQEATAVMSFDIDRFKKINDVLGHEKGDLILKEVVKKIKKILPQEMTLSRLGGDEFALLVPYISKTSLINLANNIIRELKKPVNLSNYEFELEINIGIACYPFDAKTPDDLIKNAGIAMLYGKKTNQPYTFFKQFMIDETQEKALIEQHLRKALEHNELSLVYQPQVNLKSKDIISMEALLRWDHKHLGSIPPGKFIPVAEESGLIIDIGKWVLRQACQQLHKWHSVGMTSLEVSVNISIRQFSQPDFVLYVKQIINETRIAPNKLTLEITESMTMDYESAIPILERLKQMGIKIAIDDFGTGYSSLSYLKKLPIDYLKIDRSFIQDIEKDADSCSIVETIISMAKHLKVEVIAEGIESREQLDLLLKKGCDHVQGFYLSKPLVPEKFKQQIEYIYKKII